MVQMYRRRWHRGIFASFFGYIRDSLVSWVPCRRLPKFITQCLYGGAIEFAFLVHPRTYQDIFIPLSFLAWLKLFLRKTQAYNFFASFNPFVLNQVHTPHGIKGLVIAQPTVPEIMFEKRKETVAQLKKMIRLVGKIAKPEAVIGLGGWFPMVCRRGADLEEVASEQELIITNGHCGTLVSIYMTVEKIAAISNVNFSDIRLAIIGVGKMGTNVAKVFNGKVKRLTLIDVNKANLEKTKATLEVLPSDTKVDTFLPTEDSKSFREILEDHHVGVCATSTFRNLLKLKDMPKGFIAIDDSRPEALPRDPKKERIILEGGLLKIKGATIDYNYGFGEDDNVFGCLGEAFLVALGNQGGRKEIAPTLGEVEMNNFFKFYELCKKCGVTEGDFKSAETYVSETEISEAMMNRNALIIKGRP